MYRCVNAQLNATVSTSPDLSLFPPSPHPLTVSSGNLGPLGWSPSLSCFKWNPASPWGHVPLEALSNRGRSIFNIHCTSEWKMSTCLPFSPPTLSLSTFENPNLFEELIIRSLDPFYIYKSLFLPTFWSFPCIHGWLQHLYSDSFSITTTSVIMIGDFNILLVPWSSRPSELLLESHGHSLDCHITYRTTY